MNTETTNSAQTYEIVERGNGVSSSQDEWYPFEDRGIPEDQRTYPSAAAAWEIVAMVRDQLPEFERNVFGVRVVGARWPVEWETPETD